MNFSSSLAQNITEELKEVVNQDINYFNSKAYIIASTNKDRIGDFHQGAKRVLETKKELIVEYDGEFLGSKKGINLPVYFNNDVVGVIGITGDKNEVGQYGKIIQKITQILIKDAYIKEKILREAETKKQFIEELLFKDMEDKDHFIDWGEILGINLDSFSNVTLINFFNKEAKNIVNGELYDKLYKIIEDNVLTNPNNIILQSGKNIIIIYSSKLEFKSNFLTNINENILANINSKYKDIIVKIGIGGPVNSLLDIRTSYLQATRALKIANKSKYEPIKDYNDLDIEILIDSIPNSVKTFYIEKVFSNFSPEEFLTYSNNFLEYVDANGSIKKASDLLFIHKNTLQYRLNSLYKKTGYNPRDLKDMIILYLGFMMHDYK